MSTFIEKTTVVVAVHVKVEIGGYFETPSALKREAAFRALEDIDHALDYANNTHVTTESAKALTNDAVLDTWFAK